jgi:hypothetical protein
VDTRDADHVELLSKLGIDPNTIAGKAGVVGNL